MDAAQKFCKNTGLLLTSALALFLTAPAWGQTTSLSLSTSTVTLTQSATTGSVNVTSGSTPVTYNVTISGLSNGGGNGAWLTLSSPSQQTTPSSVFVSLASTAGMGAGTYSATVTLTPTDLTVATAASFTVNWTNGSGGGGSGSSISLSQSSVTISAPVNQSAFANVTVSTTSATQITLGNPPSVTTTTCGTGWLTAFLNSSFVTNVSNANLTITGNATGLTTGSICNGSVTVTPGSGSAVSVGVVFTVGSGGGGSGTLSVAPSSFTMAYTTGGVFPTQALTITDPGATTLSIASNSTWLVVNNQSSLIISPTSAVTVGLSSVATGLATGSYSGTLSFNDDIGNTASVTVTLTVNGGSSTGLTVTPSALSFSSTVGGGAQSNTITVISTTGGAFTATPNVNWITSQVSTTNLASNTTGSVTVTVSPGGLANGTYNGNVTVAVGSQSQSVGITLVVGTGTGGGGSGTGVVAPNNIQLSWQTGTSPGFVNRPDVIIAGTSGTWSSSATTSSGGNWLSLSPSTGISLPVTTTVVADPTGLSAGTYTGTITVTTLDGSQTITVTLAVGAGPVLNARPGSVIFTYQTGQSVPAGQSVFFSTSDVTLNQGLDITGTVTANQPWITVTTFQKSIQVFVDPRGMAGGVYSGTVTVAPSGLAQVVLPVALVIDNGAGGGGGGSGPLTFSPSSLTFSAAAGTNPTAQTLTVSANIASAFSVTSNQSWLAVSPATGTTTTNLSVSATSSNLPAGSYSGTLTFTSGGSTQTVGVTLTVTGGSGGGTGSVSVTPGSFSFSAQTGSGVLPVQSLQVTSSGTYTITASTTSGGSWLSSSLGSGTGSGTATYSVTVNASGLAAGTYNGNLRVSGTNNVDVPVTLTITAPATVSASPTTLTFTYRAGGAVPAAQNISVSSNGTPLTFSATASSSGNWLVVTPATGTTPQTLSASVNPASLSAGTYNGTISVAGTGGAPGSTTINVTLTVTAPLPTITRVTNAASFASGNIAPGEIITIFGTDLGPATLAGLVLDSTGKVSTTVSNAQVIVNGYPAPLIYVSATQVAAVVPYELAQFTSANVLVKYLGQSSNGVAVNVSTTAPGIFTANSSGTGPAAALNGNGSVNAPSNPAARNDTVVLYLTGEGQTSPAGVTGKVTTVSATPPLTPAPLLPIGITIGGLPANYSFAGEAPGYVSGVLQLNVQIPSGAGSGAQALLVSIGGVASQSGVTISVQ